MRKSQLEQNFATAWRAIGDVALLSEYRFHPTRRWRFDFAYWPAKVAIEIEGGVYSRGRHTRGSGFVADCEKYNAAAELGWTVLRFPGTWLRTFEDALGVGVLVNRVIRKQRIYTRHRGLRRELQARRVAQVYGVSA